MWQALIILICLGINGLIAASELAFVSISRPRLRHLVAQGEKAAQRVLAMRENPEKVLSVLQLGQTFISIVAAAVGGIEVHAWATPIFSETLGTGPIIGEALSIALFVVPYTLFSVVVSELLPKSLALRNPKWVIYHVDRWILFLSKVLAPVVFVLEKSTKWSARLFHPWIKKEEVETGEWILVGRFVRPYMVNLAAFEGKRLADVMIPWDEVDTLEVTEKIDEVKKKVIETGHTRLPVTKEGQPTALLHTKEFHAFVQKDDPHWQTLLRPLIHFDPDSSLFVALRKMQKERCHLGVIFSGDRPMGIATIEDILEEVVGEIYDEDDTS